MEEFDAWLRKAEKDLRAAEINLQQGLYDVSAFLSHQAAEKALKAVYIQKFKALWKTHDLVGLAVKIDIKNGVMEACEELNVHYIETRYPTETRYTKSIAEEAVENAKEVLAWVRKELKK
jgi:HEPN domain-containing protein